MTDEKNNDKKQILLRISPSLWQKLSRWAEDDFRSINGQIEYVLSEAVRNKYKMPPPEDAEPKATDNANN